MYSIAGGFDKKTFIPALIGAILSLTLAKSGSFSFFYLVPLGFVAYRYSYKTAWLTFLFAVIGNIVWNIVLTLGASDKSLADLIFWDVFYFVSMIFIFTWITAPPPNFGFKISGPLRLITGSCFGALVLTLVFFRAMASQGFSEYLNYLLDSFIAAYSSSRINVVENARLDMLSLDLVLQAIKSFMLRGGSLASCVLLFFVSGQAGILLMRFSMRFRLPGSLWTKSAETNSPERNSLLLFHVNPQVIWVFSVSLFLVVISRTLKLEIPEIILWNVLVICVILYLAQGFGILQFILLKPSFPNFLRLSLVFLFVVILFSPVFNAILLGGIILLGVAENWFPLRASKLNGPPSTPEAGDGI